MAAPFTQPAWSQPRGAVKLNGELVTGWIEFEVTNSAYYAADTFRCKFSGAMLPADRSAIWFSQQQDMYVELFIGYPQDPMNYTPASLKSFIYGQVDHIKIDPVDYTIEVDGRDLSRLFIDNKTTQKWPNQTSSQIATMLAQKYGLTPVVKATTTKVGKFYEIDHVNMTDERSEWDLLNYLANIEGFKVWVRGQSLYFQPPLSPQPVDTTALEQQRDALQAQIQAQLAHINQQQQGELSALQQINIDTQAGLTDDAQSLKQAVSNTGAEVTSELQNIKTVLKPQLDALNQQIAAAQNSGKYPIVWQPTSTSSGPKANFEAVKFTRALTVSRGIQVKIRSWNKKFAKGFTVSYPSNAKTIKVGSSSVGAGAQIYSKTVPNLTQDQALQYAQNWYQQIVAHEMKIEGLTMPGDNNLDIPSMLQLSGTGTAFDQMYYTDSIQRTLSFEGGYEMTISAKNHSPDSEVTL
jgi:phage protein D